MSALRHRFKVTIDGTEHSIITSARDMAQIDDVTAQPKAENMFRLIHAAALRLNLDVPSDYEEFVDLLDDVDDLEASKNGATPKVDERVNPTKETRSATVP